eukprot:5621608-Karenia_brevis.AAC.1
MPGSNIQGVESLGNRAGYWESQYWDDGYWGSWVGHVNQWGYQIQSGPQQPHPVPPPQAHQQPSGDQQGTQCAR